MGAWEKQAKEKALFGLESKNEGVRDAAKTVLNMLKAHKGQHEILRTSAYGILVRYWRR